MVPPVGVGPATRIGHHTRRQGTLAFNSVQYALFLPLVVLGYWVLRGRARTAWLLVASYAFYVVFDWRFLGLLLFTTAVDFFVGRALGAPGGEQRHRRRLLGISLAANLGVLATFKYLGFFVEQAAALLDAVGLDGGSPGLRLLLPYGISFYTFQSMAYSIDVYRRRIEPCRDPVDFATFVAFFPQLVAGPISRAGSLLPQIQRRDAPPPSGTQTSSALLLILLGVTKKVVIADPMAGVVDSAFGGQPGAGTLLTVVGIVAFAIQIYADFSAYTDIARGSAQLFGIELVHNFTEPYLSRSITEFWRRWHMSLSSWLRDYVYVPLGGNRVGARRTYVNLVLTMVLGGLWHGAGWTFVIWGGIHGSLLAYERWRGVRVPEGEALPRDRELLAVLRTFALVCLAWVFFRAASLSQALEVLGNLADPGGAAPAPEQVVRVLVWVAGVLAIDVARRTVRRPMALVRARPALVGALVGLAVAAIAVHTGGEPVQFIYFQF